MKTILFPRKRKKKKESNASATKYPAYKQSRTVGPSIFEQMSSTKGTLDITRSSLITRQYGTNECFQLGRSYQSQTVVLSQQNLIILLYSLFLSNLYI